MRTSEGDRESIGQVPLLPPALHNRGTEIGETIYDRWGLDALEVSEEVFEAPASIVFNQAEKRLHTMKSKSLFDATLET